MASTPRPSGDPDAHEWVSFEDPDEERTWLLDVTFLASNWRCLYGCGCQGVLSERAPERAEGCCSYGAHFSGPEDIARVEAAAAELDETEWQFAARGRAQGVVARRGAHGTTRLVDGSCIFLNRPGFPAGPGCALHQAALKRRRSPMRLKPDVCWQLPLRREDLETTGGHITSVVAGWDRRHWGEAGQDFAWWCTDAPEAFSGARPVYLEMREELTELVGAAVYRRLVAHLASRPKGAALAHPTVRRATRARER
ncbi:MAG TPA: hypothetical protein VNF07_04300 [Acidimicrobiales bacterium]|nr:hypothetical protein [Acidimicrobiales bacterium]